MGLSPVVDGLGEGAQFYFVGDGESWESFKLVKKYFVQK